MKTGTGATVVALLLMSACSKGTGGNDASANAGAPAAPNAVVAAPAARPAAAAGDLAAARRLIDAVYAPYTRNESSDYLRYFTPELNAAIDRAGEGAIEADPLCECQDTNRFTYNIRSLEPEAGGALARVAITNDGEAKTITLHLVPRGTDWRIADVGEGDHSFARGLRR